MSDLIYYQGPLLSHYINSSGDNFLFYWVDSDSDFNRWIVKRVSLRDLQDYLNKKISLRLLLQNASDDLLYKVDVDSDLNYHQIQAFQFEKIPSSYLPGTDSLYEFEPRSSEATLDELLSIGEGGILQATFKNSSRVGYGTIHLNVFSPAIHHIEEITSGLGVSYFKKCQKHQLEDEKGKKIKLDKASFLTNTQFEIAAMLPGSFKLLLRPINKQIVIGNEKSETDNYCSYLLDFIDASFNYEKLLEYVSSVDDQVIGHYEKLLKNIQEYKLDFNLKWSNRKSNYETEKIITFREAPRILENINRLEYQSTEDLKLVGRFLEINLKTNHFTFQAHGEEAIECRGYFDELIKPAIVLVAFNKTYDVTIQRSESKEAGHKKAKIRDKLIAFYEVKDNTKLSD